MYPFALGALLFTVGSWYWVKHSWQILTAASEQVLLYTQFAGPSSAPHCCYDLWKVCISGTQATQHYSCPLQASLLHKSLQPRPVFFASTGTSS